MTNSSAVMRYTSQKVIFVLIRPLQENGIQNDFIRRSNVCSYLPLRGVSSICRLPCCIRRVSAWVASSRNMFKKLHVDVVPWILVSLAGLIPFLLMLGASMWFDVVP